jgi:uncharacterized protein (UPF0548 family)
MTSPASHEWVDGERARGRFRRSEVTGSVGTGDDVWNRAAVDVLSWKVKTNSGFSVDSAEPVSTGQRVIVTAGAYGIKVLEPVQVVSVVSQPDRVGFAYKTLPGHPVDGEEAFIVHRRGAEVLLTIRSLTRASPRQPWRTLYPGLLLIQRIVRWRYLRSLS